VVGIAVFVAEEGVYEDSTVAYNFFFVLDDVVGMIPLSIMPVIRG
jgi:hypothetical protein